jgi:hypothetical protein
MAAFAACNTAPARQDNSDDPPKTAEPLTMSTVVSTAENSQATVQATSTVVSSPTAAPTAAATLTPIIKLTPGKNEKALDYYPVHVGNTWYFRGYKKKEPGIRVNVKAEIVGMEPKDGKDYYYFYAPSVGIRYLIRADEKAVYMRVIKYPFPLFGFPIEVNIVPEMPIIKSPFKVGERWTYKGRAEAVILGFIKLGRDIRSDFECVRKERLRTEAGDIDAYHIKVLVDEGDGKTVTTEKYWYGQGRGYSYSDTSGHDAFILGYKLWNEKTGKWDEKIPEGAEKYE